MQTHDNSAQARGLRPDRPVRDQDPDVLVDYPGGAPSDEDRPSFTLDGVEVVLDSQPGARVTAEHEVVRGADGGIEIHLEEGRSADTGPSSKVTYKADLPETTQRVGLDYTYGEGLDAPTPAFSNMQAFFRRDPDTMDPESPSGAVKSQFLIGSDQNNPDGNFSFAGHLARSFNDGASSAFVNNPGVPFAGRLNLVQHDDGRVNTTTVAEGAGAASHNVDLDPTGAIDDFALDQLLLQVETYQADASVQEQFDGDGQVFSYDDLHVATSGPDLVGQPAPALDDGVPGAT